MFLKGETGKDGDDYPLNIEFQNPTYKLLAILKEYYQLDLTASNIHGYINCLVLIIKVILKDKNNYGLRLPNLSQDTDLLNIDCDLINESLVDGEEIEITSWKAPAYGIFTRVGEVSVIERVSAANE